MKESTSGAEIFAVRAPAGLSLDSWVCSDMHFNHENIIKYANRPFDWQERMLNSWMEQVKEGDTVLHLGDWFMGKADRFVSDVRPLLEGRLISLVGNHDRQSKKWYAEHNIEMISPFFMRHDAYRVAFTHRPHPELVSFPLTLNVHGHIHEKTMKDARFLNACIEHHGYRLVRLGDLLDTAIAAQVAA